MNTSKIPAKTRIVFRRYPRPHGFFDALDNIFGESEASVRALQGLAAIADTPLGRATLNALAETPRGGVELRATNLPVETR